MRTFAKVTRVVVTEDGPLKGKAGTKWRPRRCDDGAWFAMDDDRCNHIVLYPDQCQKEPTP